MKTYDERPLEIERETFQLRHHAEGLEESFDRVACRVVRQHRADRHPFDRHLFPRREVRRAELW